jgi:enediyne polyketide synthase
MARQLVRRFDWAKRFVKEADTWLIELSCEPITPLIFQPLDRVSGAEQLLGWRETLRQTQHAQPAICLASVLWLKYLARLGVVPAVVGGHSLGELSALHAAGAFDERSLMQLAAIRGRVMAATDQSGAMASLSCTREEADLLIANASGYCAVANLNAPTLTVVSGDRDAVERIVRVAKARSIAAVLLEVSGAFHSAHFREAANSLRQVEGVPEISNPLHTPMLSAIDGAEIRSGVSVRDYLSRQMCAEVDFVAVARSMGERCDLLLEVGPGRVLSGLVKRTVSDGRLRCFPLESRPGKDEDLNVALAALFTHGYRLRLDALYDSRLYRPFVPASERKFIQNPCERPFPDEVAPAVTPMVREPARSTFTVLPPPPASRSGSSELPHRDVAESQIVLKPTVRSAVLAGVEAQTGFPIESLTLDLRLVDDLHLDSIKTVELVSDVADQLGITEAFDAAQFADATLGELVERMELLESNQAPEVSDDSSAGPTAAQTRGEADEPSVAHFALQWDEEPLPSSSKGGGLARGHTLVLAPDSNDALVVRLLQELVERGIDARACKAGEKPDGETPFDHLLVVCPDASASGDVDRLCEVVNLLACATRLLPSSAPTSDRASCVAWIRVRSSEAQWKGHYDWSPHAFAATVHLERRQLRVRSIEFSGAGGQATQIADAVVQELADVRTFLSARYDDEGRRFVGKPRLQSRAAYPLRSTVISAGDVVVVTGGAKGITAQCALALARETRATMVLVGSSPVPGTESRGSGAEEIRKTLATFRAEGLRCHYRQCNLSGRQDVERLIANVRGDFGSVDVVIHGAGLNHPRRVEEPSASEVLDEIAPKVIGALHLFDVLDDAPPKMFVALTSIIGVIGMPHNAWYAFANQSLDRALGRFAARHPSVEAMSLAYSIWDEVGMGAKLGSVERLARLGIDAIPVEEGASRFVELVTHDPGAREVIVTARLGGVDTWQPVVPLLPRAHRFIDQILRLEPGRELVCRTKLDLDRDAYVRDHVYEGSHLLPAVFGLEAMAQAVAHVTGRAELPFPLLIEDVELTRPLVVHPDRGLMIEIQAHVEENDARMSDGQRVHAEIRCAQTGFAQTHFSACFVVGATAMRREQTVELPTRALPIRPKEHLYGSVLFQGPRFQRIDELNALDSKNCVFVATQGPEYETWLLGDPYFRDALLQSLQLCVVPDQCLPVRLDRWEIVNPTQLRPVKRIGTATIDGKEGDTYIGTVSSVSTDGAPIETLSGYRARTLLRRPEWPGAEELALRGSAPASELRPINSASDVRVRVNDPQTWDGSVFYRDVPGYGLEGQTAFFCRFPLSAQDSSSASGSLNFASYFRWAGKLREWGGMNTPGVYQGILEMLGSNEVMSATNECETRIFRVPQRNDLIEGRYWMEYVNKGDAGNIFEWWRIPFPGGEPEMIAWTRMRISAVKAIRHGLISATDWPEFLYRFLKGMGDDAPQPTKGPELKLDLGESLFSKIPGPRPGAWLAEQTFATSQEDSNVVGNIYFANYSVWQGRVTDRFFHSIAPRVFEDRGAHGELHRAQTRISQLRDAMPFDEISVVMRLDELHERGARLSFDFFRKESGGVTKIAAGHNLVAWAGVERGAEPRPVNWPDELREAMLACADDTAHAYQKPA